ncbi:MAG: hypothetical protein LUF86_02725 [Clostridiales bacterium]|nr:hypothetical protein [Clostridiales bacterium]
MKQKKKAHHSRPHGGAVPYALVKAEARRAANDVQLQYQADTATQRAMWLMVCSIADAYGFGPKRLQPFFAALQANADELKAMAEENGEDYAYEKMRLKAEHVTGTKIKYLYEHDPVGAMQRDRGGN